MSTLVTCCCDTPDYHILRPCYQTTQTLKYMSTADWTTCGFDYGTIYKNGYCGYWEPTNDVGDTLDNTCGNYTENDAGCCGGAFDPCSDNTGCCGYKRCLEYYESLPTQPVPLNFRGYIASTGSAGSAWSVQVASLNIDTPTYPLSGAADIRYRVHGNLTVTWNAAPGGTITCDTQSKPPTATVPYEFYVNHIPAYGCTHTSVTDSHTDPCDVSTQVCTGLTVTTGTGFEACDLLVSDYQGTASMTSAAPNFNNNCTPPGSGYSVNVPMLVTLNQNILDPDGCTTACTASAWHAAYFPDVVAYFSITIVGDWRIP
jgi:hypothetical protein